MSDLQSTGQDAPVVIDQATPPEAAPAPAATAPAQTDGADGGEKPVPVAPKTFTQAELDEVVQREKAKAEAKAERRVLRTIEKVMPAQQQAAPQQQRQPDGPPPRTAFANDEAWLDARDAWRDQQREQQTSQKQAQEKQTQLQRTTEQVYAKAATVPGFDREAFDELPLTRDIVETLLESEQPHQLMAYMAAHPDEVARIAELSPKRQSAELGKLEAKLAAIPPVKTSKAPDPITPIGSGKTPVHDLQSADMDSYLAMRKKQGARWAN